MEGSPEELLPERIGCTLSVSRKVKTGIPARVSRIAHPEIEGLKEEEAYGANAS